MKIYLHIERLVLEGLPVGRLHVLRQALQRELATRLMQEGLSPDLLANRSIRSICVPAISFGTGSDPDLLSGNIARAVYRGIGARAERAHPGVRAGVVGGAK